MLFEAQDPNSKEPFLIDALNLDVVVKHFPVSCFQVRELNWTDAETEALSTYGSEVASGELNEQEATLCILSKRFEKIVIIGSIDKILWTTLKDCIN